MPGQEERSVAREVAARILSLRKEGESDADFARRLDISPQLLQHYKNGGGASVEAIARITRNEKRAYWLLTGEEAPSFRDGAKGDGGKTDGAGKDGGAFLAEVRHIVRDTTLPPAYRVLLVAEIGAAYRSRALDHGEIGGIVRAHALVEAEEADKLRTRVIGRVEHNANERLRSLHESKAPDAPLSPYNPPPEPSEGEEKRTAS